MPEYINGHLIYDYMKPEAETLFETENYVSSPPALIVQCADGSRFTLANDIQPGPTGEFMFSVLRNAHPTGEYASRIERRAGKIRIFTLTGWKVWTGKSFF